MLKIGLIFMLIVMICLVLLLNLSIDNRLSSIFIIVVRVNVVFIIMGNCFGCFMLFFTLGNIVCA